MPKIDGEETQRVTKRREFTARQSRNARPRKRRAVHRDRRGGSDIKRGEDRKRRGGRNETTEEEESEPCTGFGVEPTAQTGQNETEPTLVAIEVVDQKGVEEGVLRMLAETDWEIEPGEEREGEETNRPAATVPVEAGADGKVAEMSAENRPFLEIILGGESYRALLDSGAMAGQWPESDRSLRKPSETVYNGREECHREGKPDRR